MSHGEAAVGTAFEHLDVSPRLPQPAGPVSGSLISALSGDSAPSKVVVRASADVDPLTDDDLHRALYILYELHYRGFDGVDPRMEWDLDLLAARRGLEEQFINALIEDVGRPEEREADGLDAYLHQMLKEHELPPMPRYLETQATLEQFEEYVIHRSAFQLKEADPQSWSIPRFGGAPKAALLEIQIDEYGGGFLSRMHSELFVTTMKELGLNAAYGHYLDQFPGVTLATVNLMSLFGLHRRWLGASIGSLAAFEMGSSAPNRRYSNGLQRLGGSKDARTFYDVHVLADAAHEQVAASDLALGLARQQPFLAGDIIFGARVSAACEGRFFAHLLNAWKRNRSSLLGL
jgi:heme oxygenase-like protein